MKQPKTENEDAGGQSRLTDGLYIALTEEAKQDIGFVPNSGVAVLNASKFEQFEKESAQHETSAA